MCDKVHRFERFNAPNQTLEVHRNDHHLHSAKVPEHIYCHMFRYSRAMHLYRNGMPMPLFSEWLVHSQITTTIKFYANADTFMKQEAINKATSVFNPILQDDKDFDFENDDELLKKLYGLK